MFLYVAAFVIGLILVATMPKPQGQPPQGLENIKAPTAEEGRAIPVVFGTRLIEGPNVVWYGDISNEAIKR